MSSRELSATRPLFTVAANNAIQCLSDGGKKGDCRFPRYQGWDETLPRVKTLKGEDEDKTLLNWFKRVIGGGRDRKKRLNECALENRFAFFGKIVWTKEGVTFCGLQALVTEGTLEEFLEESSNEATYYRLDFDPTKPGPLFKECQPHIHSTFEGPPRFPFWPRPNEFLPTAFIEFIYLNHFHDLWLSWAEREAEFGNKMLPFVSIVEAYKSTDQLMLRLDEFKSHIAELKGILHAAKRKHVPNAPLVSDGITLINY